MSQETTEKGREVIDQAASRNADDLIAVLYEDAQFRPDVFEVLKIVVEAESVDERIAALNGKTLDFGVLDNKVDKIADTLIKDILSNKAIDPDVLGELRDFLIGLQAVESDNDVQLKSEFENRRSADLKEEKIVLPDNKAELEEYAYKLIDGMRSHNIINPAIKIALERFTQAHEFNKAATVLRISGAAKQEKSNEEYEIVSQFYHVLERLQNIK